MDALEMLKGRRAVRKYKSAPVDDAALEKVLEAGTYAPTGCGTQGFRIVVVQDPATLKTLKTLNASIMGKGPETDPYYGAPVILLVLTAPEAVTGIWDGSAVCTNLANAAYAVGLSTCWIHRCKEMFETAEGKALLKKWGLDENCSGVASLALGYADGENKEAPARKPGLIVRI